MLCIKKMGKYEQIKYCWFPSQLSDINAWQCTIPLCIYTAFLWILYFLARERNF